MSTNETDDSNPKWSLWLVLTVSVLLIAVGVALTFVTLSHNEQHVSEETANIEDIVVDPDLSSNDQQSDSESVDVEERDDWDWEVKRPSKPRLSPEWMENLISSLEIDMKKEDVRLKVEPIDRDSIIREARRNVKEKKWMEAKRLYR